MIFIFHEVNVKTVKIHILLIVLSVLLAGFSSKAAPECSVLFNESAIEQAKNQIEKDRSSWAKYKHQNDSSALDFLSEIYTLPDFLHVIPHNEAKKMLTDTDLPLYGQILKDVIHEMKNSIADIKSLTNVHFERALKAALNKHNYSPEIVNKKVVELHSTGKRNWKSILGDLTLAETHQLFYGNDINNPSIDSLIGKYIQETGAQMRMVQFPKTPRGSEMGPAKMVIAVSNSSFETFKELILNNRHYMSVVGHANVLHNGSFYSFGGQKSEIRFPGNLAPVPLLIVKTTESQRLNRYMELTTDRRYTDWYGQNPLKKPWYLESYCARGGYECCTHWLGNIPIGDKRVKEYSFPPREHNDENGPRVQPLQQYEVTDSLKDLSLVWKSPGHQQLSHVIGQKQANDVGEMASPGYVIHTLIGPTKAERVPVVFWMTDNHKAEIPERPNLNFENPY